VAQKLFQHSPNTQEMLNQISSRIFNKKVPSSRLSIQNFMENSNEKENGNGKDKENKQRRHMRKVDYY
jgi:hypothetical protein